MKSFQQISKILVGVSALALMTGTISCGKKKGGGGTVATPPTTTDCQTTDCTVGQQYASGVFLRNGVGQANYGQNQNIIIKLGFYGKDASGLQMKQTPVVYNGAVDVTGTARLSDGRYYGVSSTSTRMVSALSLSFDIDLGFGGSTNGNAYNVNYNSNGGDSYYLPCGYNGCGNGHKYPTPKYPKKKKYPKKRPGCQAKYKNCPTQPQPAQCLIPIGDYTVETVQSGQWKTRAYDGRATFSNLKVRFRSGDLTVEASFTQGYFDKYASQIGGGQPTTSGDIIRGNMIVHSINGQACDDRVNF
jgi:hypothetical protein